MQTPPLELTPTNRFQAFLQARVITPLLSLLRIGASPRQLALALAVGAVIGINPLFGSATVFCIAAAWLFRLNYVAAQIANFVVYPFQIALFFVFIRIGNAVFRTAALPLERAALMAAIRTQPMQTLRLLWTWQWHALVVWLACAAVLIPLLTLTLEPVLNRLLQALKNEPVIEK